MIKSVNHNQQVAYPQLGTKRSLPFLVWLLLAFTVLGFYASGSFFGFNISGIAWVTPLAAALLVLGKKPQKISFPVWIWLPWVVLLLTYLVIVDYRVIDPRVIPVQRTVQLLSPLLIGMAVSTLRPAPIMLTSFVWWLRILCMVLFAVTLFKLSHFFVSGFGDYSGMAAQMITVILLCTLLAHSYLLHKKKCDLILWALLLVLPVINVTRTATAAVLLTFPLAFWPMRLSRRIGMLALIAIVGTAVFYMPRVQQKMFYSGQGEISDVLSDDFATSGRSFMWEQMSACAKEEYWTGHGTGAGETLVFQLTGITAYPHNDWLLTYYDYGVFGIVIFTGCLLLSIWHPLRQARACRQPETRLLLLTGASSFIPFMLLMLTDNIMIYASFFGNLHYTILGLAYGALRVERLPEPRRV